MRRLIIAMAAAALLIGMGLPLVPSTTQSAQPQVIRLTARKFEYNPKEIVVKKNVSVVLEITSVDRDHGFKLRAFGIRADVKPGRLTRVQIRPDKTGRFPFECDVFCGSGHEDMGGELVVVD